MVVLLRSFILICNELGIPEIEYSALSQIIIHKLSIQEWTDLPLDEFTKKKSKLTTEEKRLLVECLKECEGFLK